MYKFEVYQDRTGEYRFRASSGETMFSSESYVCVEVDRVIEEECSSGRNRRPDDSHCLNEEERRAG
jgi:hypothetical protein